MAQIGASLQNKALTIRRPQRYTSFPTRQLNRQRFGLLLLVFGSILIVETAQRAIAVTICVGKWGNSLGLRIPKALAEQVGLQDGTAVEITVESGRLVIVPAQKSLDVLLARITPENLHGETDDGLAVGQEVW